MINQYVDRNTVKKPRSDQNIKMVQNIALKKCQKKEGCYNNRV